GYADVDPLRAGQPVDAGRDVPRPADDVVPREPLAPDEARDDRSAVNSHPHLERGPARGDERRVVVGERAAHGEGRVNRVVGLPGIGLERTEERQDTVAEELRDVAAVLDDGLAHALEVAAEDGHQLAGREAAPE